MKRMDFLKWMALGASSVALPGCLSAGTGSQAVEPVQPVAEQFRKPNIIFILADDMGWGDLSSYGHPELKTPNLDRLAARGKLFTQFYACAGVCSPSRVAFTTGRYPARYGIHGHISNHEENQQRAMPDWLDPTVPTVAKKLKAVGYATAHFGKWHMCLPSGEGAPEPSEYGFDKSYGYLASGPQLPIQREGNPWFRAQSTEAIVDETIRFIEENKDRPFYINAWTLVPHTVLNPTPEQMEPFMKFAPPLEGHPHVGAKVVYYASINDLDTQVGRLLDKLDELGVADNTLIIFSSDNGPEDMHVNGASHSGIGSPGPFRGRKRSLYEGGIRVPFIAAWPGRIEPGVVDNESVLAAADLMPTFCALAGVDAPDGEYVPDGVDMLDVLVSNPRKRTTPLMWEFHFAGEFGHVIHKNPIMAIREGDWKLMMNLDRSRIELYDIPNDPTELDNLADREPQRVKKLSAELMKWHEDLPRAPIAADAGNNDYPWPESH
jgi:arylsulfatase A-like enzyme